MTEQPERPQNGSHTGADIAGDSFFRTLTDELYEELVDQVAEARIVGLALWEESIADEQEGIPPDARDVFDLDIYLDNQIYLELYAVYIFSDPDGDPLRGLEPTGKIVSQLIEEGIWLDELAATEEDELVLILSRHHQPQLYLNVGGWSLAEWESLPDES